MFITNEIPSTTAAYAVLPHTSLLKKAYSKVSNYDEPYVMYREIGKGSNRKLLVPRASCPMGLDKRVDGVSIDFTCSFKPRSKEQERIVSECDYLLKQDESFILESSTGSGKCLARNIPVLMYNGTIKMSQDIILGDRVMGSDSTVRNVLNVNIQEGECVDIIPVKGDKWRCNLDHILHLKQTRWYMKNGGGSGGKWMGGDYVNITVRDYLEKSKSWKHKWKLVRTGVEFPHLTVRSPYVIGLYLSDGHKHNPIISLGFKKLESLQYLYDNYLISITRSSDNSCYRVTGGFQWLLDSTYSAGENRIPKEYLVNSRKNRLELLAGILDGDGHMANAGFEITCKDTNYKDQLLFLIRSIGLAAYASVKPVKLKTWNERRDYWRILISGDCSVIPCKNDRCKAPKRKQIKDVLVTGFKVEPVGVDTYYGMSLDGDHLYLLGDFTVTHNTVMSMQLIANVGKRTLVVVTKSDLRDQWIKAAKQFLGLKDSEIGIIQGTKTQVTGKKLVIAMVQSMSANGKYSANVWSSFGFVIFDECYTPDTELLTSTGWKFIAEITKEDEVIQVDAKTGAYSFTNPTDLIEKPFKGDLVNLTNMRMDLLATPNHEHLVYTENGEPKKVTYEDFKPLGGYKTRYAGQFDTEGLGIEPLEQLAIAFQADGTLLRKRLRKNDYSVRFMFRKPRKINRLKDILNNCAIPFKESINSRGDTSITYFVKEKPLKDLGFIKLDTASSRYYQDVLNELVLWDDNKHEDGSFQYNTAHQHCADIVQAVASLAGFITTCNTYSGRKLHHAPRVRVSWYGTVLRSTKSVRKSRVPYNDQVYCIRVPKGNVVVRRNGKVSVSGNCHRVAADHFSNACWLVPAKLRLGLSATPNRSDGKYDVIKAHIGPVRVVSKALNLIPRILVKKTMYELPMVTRKNKKTGKYEQVPMPVMPGRTMHVSKLMGKDHRRNKLIAEFVKICVEKGRAVMVMADTLEHLENIYASCIAAKITPKKIGMYTGATPKSERPLVEKNSQVILCTYKFTSEGTDIPRMDTLVMATPKSDAKQIIGRILRIYEGKHEPLVLDMYDVKVGIFKGYFSKRMAWYKEIGASVKIS